MKGNPKHLMDGLASGVVRAWRSTEARMCAALALLSTGVAVLTMQLWSWSPTVPMGTSGDFTLAGMIVKGIQDNGGYLENPRLGWPFGLQLYDLPIGDDSLNLLMMRLIGWFTPNFAATMWVFMLVTFPLVAIGGYLVARRLGASQMTSSMVGLLYSFVQYHFRGQVFLLLIGYYVLPFALLLAFRVFQGVPLFARRQGIDGWRGWFSRRTIATLATCLAIGSTGLYLAAFAVVVIATAAVVQFVARSGRRSAATGIVAICLIIGMIGVNTSPSILYRLENGANKEVAVRGNQESEIYGLTLTRLIFPPFTHRFDPAQKAGERYQATTALPLATELSGYIGIIATIGLAGLTGFAFVGMTRGVSEVRRRRYGPLAAGAAIAFLFGMVGGINTVFSYAVLPLLRGTGRITIVVSFCALVAVALALDSWRTRVASRRRLHVAVFPAIVLGITALGLYDQTGTALVPAYYKAVQTEWDAMDRFVGRAEASVPRGTAVYTLPEQQFPESPGPGALLDYDSGVGYLHSKELKWSYGAVRNRQGRWLLRMSGLGLRRKLETVSACGFGAIWLDRAGYPNPDVVSAQVRGLVGIDPIKSEDGRREFFSLVGFNDRERARLPQSQRTAMCNEYLRSGRTKIG